MPDDKVEKIEKFELAKDPAFMEMQRLMKGLVTVVQQQGAGFTEMRGTLAALSKPAEKPIKKEVSVDDDDDVDVDSMSQKDFMKLMLKQVGGIVDTKLGAVTEKLDGTVKNLTQSDLRKQVETFREKHKDFNDWTDEMTALSRENPTLSIDRLYRLARDENPDKVKEVDAKYVDKKDDSNGNADEGLTLFGGFKPVTKTSNGDGKDTDKTKMTIDQAAEKAWEEAVQATPGLAKFSGDALD